MPELTFRQRWLSAPLLSWVRRVLPAMSETEREALAAGTVWWDAELMRGDPQFGRLLGMPEHRLTPEERAFIEGPVEELCRKIDDWRITFEERDIPQPIWDQLKRDGFLGLIIPKAYGGKGFSGTANSEIVLKIASRGPSAAVAVIVPNSLGPGELLMLFGTERAEAILAAAPRRRTGDPGLRPHQPRCRIGCRIDDRLRRGRLGRGRRQAHARHARQLGQALYSLGPICTVLGLAFRLFDPDHILGDQEDLGITVALVPSRTPGHRDRTAALSEPAGLSQRAQFRP